MLADALEALGADVGGEGVRGHPADQAEEVGPVEHAREVEPHAHAQGERRGHEGHAQRRALLKGERRRQPHRVVVERYDILLVRRLAEVAVVGRYHEHLGRCQLSHCRVRTGAYSLAGFEPAWAAGYLHDLTGKLPA